MNETGGPNTFIGNSILARATRIEVADDVLISGGCNIVDQNSHAIGWKQRSQNVRDSFYTTKDWTHILVKPVKIGNKCWLALNVIVLKGAVVAPGSVVTKNVPPWTVVAGNPAMCSGGC